MAERKIPHSLDAEQSVLGAMLLSHGALETALEGLSSDLFYVDAHAKIFTCLEEMASKNIPIDIKTLTIELDNRKWLQQIGGVEYLTEIVSIVPSASNISEYIKTVQEKATRRRLIEEANKIADRAFDSSERTDDVLDDAEKSILNVVKVRQGSEFKKIQDVLMKTQADLEFLAQNKSSITGIPLGFYDLDKLTSGFHANELIIIAARPGLGKTAFALNMATNVAINTGKTVALFNMEMGAEQLANRMISSVGQIDGFKMRTGKLEHNDWKRFNEAFSRLANTKMYIDDTPGMTISEIRAKCRRLATSPDGLDMIIIDYLQLINGSARYAGNRQQEIAEISRSLKTLAMELEVPIVALAQLSRAVDAREDKRPMLSDLRESGSIEQDADIVAFLYREDYYDHTKAIDEFTSKAEFIIGKHRNGPTATIDLIFKKNTSTFVNFVNAEPSEGS